MNVEPGMKTGVCNCNIDNDDILGKTGVDGFQHPFHRDGGRSAEMKHLAQGMDAGVSASGAVDSHRMPEESGQCLLDASLHCPLTGLNLPAGKILPVVADCHPIGEIGIGSHWLDRTISVLISMNSVAHKSLLVNFKVLRRVRFSPPR